MRIKERMWIMNKSKFIANFVTQTKIEYIVKFVR